MKAALDDEKTVQQNVSEYDTIAIDGQRRHIIGYLQDFLFPPERSRTQVKFLSGGERSRLLLARLFTKPSNVLVLDEPTNDLDIETLELLESLLVNYQGTVLLVSHDRAFLNDVVTSTLAIEADGRVKEYDGGYDDYLRQRREEAPAEPKAAPGRRSRRARRPSRPRKLEPQGAQGAGSPARPDRGAGGRPRRAARRDGRPVVLSPGRRAIAEAKARLEAIEGELASAYERWEALEGLAG